MGLISWSEWVAHRRVSIDGYMRLDNFVKHIEYCTTK
jgi:hypothetical protein